MANSYENLRWILDTEGTVSASLKLRIRRIVWNSPTTGNILEILDGNDDEITKITCAADASQIIVDFGDSGRRATGLNLADLDGGTVAIDLL